MLFQLKWSFGDGEHGEIVGDLTSIWTISYILREKMLLKDWKTIIESGQSNPGFLIVTSNGRYYDWNKRGKCPIPSEDPKFFGEFFGEEFITQKGKQ